VEGRESAGGRSRNIGYGASSTPVISVNMKGKASVVIGTTSGQIYSAPAFSPTTNKAIMYSGKSSHKGQSLWVQIQ
jgi:hypothetical protein